MKKQCIQYIEYGGRIDTKRKPPCIGLGWYKYAIATQWYQFHTTDKCGFLFMPWITDQYTIVRYTKLVNKIGTVIAIVIKFSIMTT